MLFRSFFYVGFGGDVHKGRAFCAVAGCETGFVAYGRHARGDGRGVREFVRLGEERGLVALSDFEVPVFNSIISSCDVL